MTFKFADRVAETSTTSGTGTVTLAGAKTGYAAFTTYFSNGDTTDYCITDGTNWEVGRGTFTTSGTTLSRDTVYASSNSNALVSFSGASKDVFCTVPSNMMNGGKQTMWVPAGAMTARTTNGMVSATIESTTNKIMQKSMDTADGTKLYAQFTVRMPKSWNASTVTASFVWTANSTSTASVVWGIQGVALANDATIDAAFGTAVEVTDANTATAYQVHLSTETTAVTISSAGSMEWVIFQVYRDPANGSDTLAATACLLGVNLYYTTNIINDA